jgi:hypothetical protein
LSIQRQSSAVVLLDRIHHGHILLHRSCRTAIGLSPIDLSQSDGRYGFSHSYGTIPTLPIAKNQFFSSKDLMTTIGFNGLTVAAFESRMAVEIARLIERQGGKPLVSPALREIPLDDNSAALKFGVKLTTERVDLLILLTGVGTTALFDLLKTRHPWSSIVAALKQTALVARGPKPVAALKALGLQPTLTVPEPNTWIDLISTLDEYRPVK